MRRTITVLVIIVILAGAGYLLARQQQARSAEEIEIVREATVERDQITATVSATGSIEPEALVSLGFRVGGPVQQVNVTRGQMVSAGDVLATLDTEELALAVQQAEDALNIQKLTLQQVLNAQSSPATLASAQADIDAAEGNLIIAQANLEAAEASLSQTQAQRAQVLAGPTAGDLAAVQSQLTQAQQQQKAAQDAYERTTTCVTVTQPSGETSEVCPGLGLAEEQARANLANANASLAAAQARLADLNAGARPADLQVANAAVQAAEAQVSSAEGNVAVAEANLARARASYDRLQERPTEDEINILEAQVTSAETNLALAQLRLKQAMIVAPMDGRVASVLISQGEQAAPGAPAVTIVDEEGFHIEVSVDEIDIDQIVEGQPVDITLDALGDISVPGTVAEIAPTAATTGIGVVTYQVTVNIEGDDVDLRPGMTANASIVVSQKDDVLTVPNWAIRLDRENGRTFVNRLLPDGSIEEVTVETGLRNEQFSEVLSGLVEGDQVVVTNEREGLSGFFGG